MSDAQMRWSEVLRAYRLDPALFDRAFVARWADEPWDPNEDDKRAAAKLHTELVSRIATQRLGYLEGDEKTALQSIHALFQKTRDITESHPTCRHFDALAWHVLNTYVRPFTAKWHHQSERGGLSALDATDEFRAELDKLRPVLQRLDHLLVYVRDGVPSPWPVPDVAATEDPVAIEMQQEVRRGIRPKFSGLNDPEQVEAINAAEAEAIRKRREYYELPQTKHAAALALSGGGIRSATFSLGVLVALAERGLLPQFDYLSTVSGGGYLGSFLTVFLQSRRNDVGLKSSQLPFKREEGEAAALRHLRHHSKHLAVDSAWSRIKIFCGQFLGIVLNALAVAWILSLLVGVEWGLELLPGANAARMTAVSPWTLWILLGGAVVSMLMLRVRRSRYADTVLALATLPLVAALGWNALGWLHNWDKTTSSGQGVRSVWLGDKEIWLAIAGAVPFLAPALAAVFPRLLKGFHVALAAVSLMAVPVFLLGVYLLEFANRDWLTPSAAKPMPIGLLLLLAGGLVYFFGFDINSTSPHRYYRRKLAQAYLIQPKPKGTSEDHFDEEVSVRLSEVGKHTSKAPYHLMNCALNVPASDNIGMQGRLTDFFLFSPAYSGSPLIGYKPTVEWEKLDSRLDVGTVMAISGAAVAPQMGLGTRKRLSFWLALLNIRLGYWARHPGVGKRTWGAPGISYLLREMFGWMDENRRWINLSDGGHIENLGIYELLRRRCKYIVAVDGEEDAGMTFRGLTTLQRMAAIDLGVSIDIDLDDLRLKDSGLSRTHFRFCRIRYPIEKRGTGDEFGYLLYVKLSLTGNEGEFVRRYRLDEPNFPHHSTADQLFDETQFEAYRSLGEHIGNKLFLRAIVGDLADSKDVNLEWWFSELGKSLLEPAAAERPQTATAATA